MNCYFAECHCRAKNVDGTSVRRAGRHGNGLDWHPSSVPSGRIRNVSGYVSGTEPERVRLGPGLRLFLLIVISMSLKTVLNNIKENQMTFDLSKSEEKITRYHGVWGTFGPPDTNRNSQEPVNNMKLLWSMA